MKKIFTAICFSLLSCYLQAQVETIKNSLHTYSFIAEVSGKLLFFATDRLDYNYELWVSDGTEAGTQQLKDINPGADGSILDPSYWGPQFRDKHPVEFNNALYFLAYEPTHGMEIWKSDGTESGTIMLKDIHPGTDGFFYPYFYYPYFTEMDGELYFSANDGVHGWELWKTDGTEAGTEMVADISTDDLYGSNPEHLINFNGTLIFTARDDVYGYEIYKSDGTAAGTEIIKDIVPGISGSMNDGYAGSIDPLFTVSGEYLYFLGRLDDASPVELHVFRTDVTSAGTFSLENDLQYITDFTDVNGACFFYAFDGDYDHSGLWKSDGTEAGTELMNTDDIFAYNHFYNFDNTLFFSGGNASYDEIGLYKSNGTTEGTELVKAFEGLSSFPDVDNFITDDGSNSFFYRALLKVSDISMGWRYVQTNGTTEGTKIFYGASPFRAGAFLDGQLYFPGIDTTGSEYALYALNPVEFIDNPDEIQEFSSEQFCVFPNPASENIYIQNLYGQDILSVEFINISGAEISQQIYVSESHSHVIHTDAIESGLYLIKINCEGSIYNYKVIISH